VELLLKKNCEIDALNSSGRTPLFYLDNELIGAQFIESKAMYYIFLSLSTSHLPLHVHSSYKKNLGYKGHIW